MKQAIIIFISLLLMLLMISVFGGSIRFDQPALGATMARPYEYFSTSPTSAPPSEMPAPAQPSKKAPSDLDLDSLSPAADAAPSTASSAASAAAPVEGAVVEPFSSNSFASFYSGR
jgi:hypothetical protein